MGQRISVPSSRTLGLFQQGFGPFKSKSFKQHHSKSVRWYPPEHNDFAQDLLQSCVQYGQDWLHLWLGTATKGACSPGKKINVILLETARSARECNSDWMHWPQDPTANGHFQGQITHPRLVLPSAANPTRLGLQSVTEWLDKSRHCTGLASMVFWATHMAYRHQSEVPASPRWSQFTHKPGLHRVCRKKSYCFAVLPCTCNTLAAATWCVYLWPLEGPVPSNDHDTCQRWPHHWQSPIPTHLHQNTRQNHQSEGCKICF